MSDNEYEDSLSQEPEASDDEFSEHLENCLSESVTPSKQPREGE
jgi:hypothetical protein